MVRNPGKRGGMGVEQYWDKVVEGAYKLGGPLALIGAGIGAYLAWPKCSIDLKSPTRQTCHNFFGPLPGDTLDVGQFLGLVVLGALVGAFVALAILVLRPGSEDSLGIPKE